MQYTREFLNLSGNNELRGLGELGRGAAGHHFHANEITLYVISGDFANRIAMPAAGDIIQAENARRKPAMQVLQGTWEEVKKHDEELAGKQVTLIVAEPA